MVSSAFGYAPSLIAYTPSLSIRGAVRRESIRSVSAHRHFGVPAPFPGSFFYTPSLSLPRQGGENLVQTQEFGILERPGESGSHFPRCVEKGEPLV